MKKTTILSSDQNDALEDFIFWLENKEVDVPFLLSGFAGSGKTLLSTKFLQIAEDRNICWTVAAPTHKAVDVLCKALEHEGLRPTWYPSTVHRLLRLRLKRRGDLEICEQTEQTAKSLDQIGLVLLDEASMIDSTLLEIIIKCSHSYKTRLIFVGDPAQLPPVGETKSPVFLLKRATKAHLTEVMRHQGPLLKLANLLRQESFPCHQPPCFPIIKSQQCLIGSLDQKSWLKRAKTSLKLAAEMKNPDAARILCYTNRYLDRLVPHARRAVHGDLADEMPVLPGEILISRRAIMTLASLSESAGKDKNSILFGSNTELVVDDVKNDIFDWSLIDLKQKESFNLPEINSLVAQVSVGKVESFIRLMPVVGTNSRLLLDDLMNYLCSKAKSLPKKEARLIWRNFFNIRDSFASVGPASVLTVHRSQGSTFQEVFVAADVFSANDYFLRKQLAYVAVSRASKEVWLAGDQSINLLDDLWNKNLLAC